jgi:NTE family protein
MKALILGGGSVKGSWQAGALKALSETGFVPDIIVGISVGSLNGTFITNLTGEGKSFQESCSELVSFWLKNIKSPDSIVRKKSTFKLAKDIIFSKDPSLTSFGPLEKKLKSIVSQSNIYKSNIDIYVGCVNLSSGGIEYHSKYSPGFLDYVIASSSIPLIMPIKHVDDAPYLDGGLIDSAGVSFALDKFYDRLDEVVLITPHSERLNASTFNDGNILQVADRIMDIISSGHINKDIKLLERSGVKHTVIRPYSPLNIEISSFISLDIANNISNGYRTALKILSNK